MNPTQPTRTAQQLSRPVLPRRGLLGLGLGLGAGAVLTACGGGGSAGVPGRATSSGAGGAAGYDGPKVALKFWNGFTGGDGPIMKKLVDTFNSEHPNIAVTMNTMQWADYYAKLPTAVAAGQGPEIAIMHVDSVATNAARRVIQPLDDVAAALKLEESDFAPVPWKAGIFNDKRYSIPLDVHPLGFFYNKTVMEQAGLDPENPPMDAESYMSALDALKAKGIQGHWASPFPFTGGLTCQALVWQFGGELFNEEGTEVKWGEDGAVKALTWFSDLVGKGYSPAKIAQDADFIALQNGKTAFNWNGIWSINTLNEKQGLEWGVAPLPNIGGTKAAWAGSHQFVLPTLKTPDENKSTAARVFLNWISQKSIEWAKAGQVPARNSVRESAEFEAIPGVSTLATQIDDLHFLPPVPGLGDAMVEWDKAVNQIVLGRKDPAATLAQTAERAGKILEANTKKYGG